MRALIAVLINAAGILLIAWIFQRFLERPGRTARVDRQRHQQVSFHAKARRETGGPFPFGE